MTGQVNKYFSEFFPISDLEFWSEKQQRMQQPTSSIVFLNEKSYAKTIYVSSGFLAHRFTLVRWKIWLITLLSTNYKTETTEEIQSCDFIG